MRYSTVVFPSSSPLAPSKVGLPSAKRLGTSWNHAKGAMRAVEYVLQRRKYHTVQSSPVRLTSHPAVAGYAFRTVSAHDSNS